jgi:hypothetical protein
MYGVFKDKDEMHVIPCTKEGEVLHPHTVDISCPCRPQYDSEEHLIVIHNEIH